MEQGLPLTDCGRDIGLIHLVLINGEYLKGLGHAILGNLSTDQMVIVK